MQIGLTHTARLIVGAAHLAHTMGSGNLPVLATPAMMALMEQAAMLAVAPHLPLGHTTVGTAIQSTHLLPTALGQEVMATATLTAVEGRRLTFSIQAHNAQGQLLGSGAHERYVVDSARFMAKVEG